MNALLFAHHADIYARTMRTQKGQEQFSAMDYFTQTFALRDDRRGTLEGALILMPWVMT